MPISFIIFLFTLFLSSLGCHPPFDEAKFKMYYDKLHAYDICGNDRSNVDCLKKHGWTLDKRDLAEVEEKAGNSKTELRKKEWAYFIGKYQPGDEIWFFQTPPETWGALMGTEGYMLKRDNIVLSEIWTALN